MRRQFAAVAPLALVVSACGGVLEPNREGADAGRGQPPLADAGSADVATDGGVLDQDSGTSADKCADEPAAWTSVNPSPSRYTYTAIWGSGPRDVWAVGGLGGPGTISRSVILLWNGTAWSPSVYPVGPTLADAGELYGDGFGGVWGSGPSDVWVVGWASWEKAFGARILHWDGAAWSPSLDPGTVPVGTGGCLLSGVWGSGPSDVWAVGGCNARGDTSALFLHWDGKAWARSSSPGRELTGVWGTGPDDVWAVGATSTSAAWTQVRLHWDGKGWMGSAPEAGKLWSIGGTGACDVWALGWNGQQAPLVLHRGCSDWSDATPPSSAAPTTSPSFNGVWGSSACDVWLTGDETILHHM